MSLEATHIDPEALAGALYRRMVENEAGIERLARSYGRLLSFSSVMELTGWGEKKLMRKIREGVIPMVKDGEWFITYPAYLRAIEKYYSDKLPKKRFKT